MENETCESATSPPKRLAIPSTSSIAGEERAAFPGAAARVASLILGNRELALAHRRGQEPGGAEEHHHHHRKPEKEHADHLGIDEQAPEKHPLHRLHGVAQDLRHEGEED